MSRDVSPVQDASTSHPQLEHHNEPETFDLLADVSHHGSTLFELLSLPNSLEPSFAPHPPTRQDFRPRQEESPLGVPVDFHALHSQQVDSFCTVDPTDFTSVPVTAANVSGQPPLHPRAPTKRHAVSKKLVEAQKPPLTRPRQSAKSRKTSRASKKAASPGATSAVTPAETKAKSRAKLPPARTIAKPRGQSPSTNPSTSAAKRIHEKSEEGNDSDASDGSDAGGSGTSKAISVTPNGDFLSGGDGQNKDMHNSHTRRCRAKVNSKFQELLSILPAPPPKTGIKHKAQILDYTIRVFREIHARKTLLEAELALSSRSQLHSWVQNVIVRSKSIQDALAPYLSLICTKGGWKYSEAWVPTQEPVRTPRGVEGMSGESSLLTPGSLVVGPHTKLRLGLAVIPSLGNTDDPDLQAKLERFRDRSRPYGCRARVDLPGRIMCTMRPEWLPSLEDSEAFQRARLAREATLMVCFGVPIFVRGHVAAVAVFFDTEHRAYDAKYVDLADNVAALMGHCFGSSGMKR